MALFIGNLASWGLSGKRSAFHTGHNRPEVLGYGRFAATARRSAGYMT